MPIKCGRGHYHDTVAEVRDCYADRLGSKIATLDYRQNMYAGTCATCGGTVPVKKGRIEKNANNKWITYHLPNQCPEKLTAQPPVDDQDHFSQIPRGHYATKSLTGNNDFDFWRVDRPEQGTYAGRTFVKRIVGGKPDMNVSRSVRIAALTAILEEGIEETGFRYGQELGKCRHCNRHLTDELSRSLSAGPECRSKKR